jgi:hypothetical protein
LDYSWSSHPQLQGHLTQLHGLAGAVASAQQHVSFSVEAVAFVAITEQYRITATPPKTMDAKIVRVQDRILLIDKPPKHLGDRDSRRQQVAYSRNFTQIFKRFLTIPGNLNVYRYCRIGL